jgi:hypothetical protein
MRWVLSAAALACLRRRGVKFVEEDTPKFGAIMGHQSGYSTSAYVFARGNTFCAPGGVFFAVFTRAFFVVPSAPLGKNGT